MLDHELAIIVQAERERAIREARLHQDLPARPGRLSALVRSLARVFRPGTDSERAAPHPREVARDIASAVSARPDRHGAC
jgi:hypothetical protein